MSRKIIIAIIVAILLLVALANMTGYIDIGGQTTYTTEEEASEGLTHISSGLEDISSTLNEIDESLSGG